MNILILGSTGFIGSWITTEFIKSGYKVTCGVRNVAYAQQLFPGAKIIACDFTKDTLTDTWKPRLKNIDIVINCIGIFYHPNKKTIWQIHFATPRAIYDAAFETNVKKIIHISALNVEKYSVEYARSKKAIEEYLKKLDVVSIILKPSLVYGPSPYGGMAILRALASTPFFIPVPGKGRQRFQPIHVDDLTAAIKHFLTSKTNESAVYAAVPPEKITVRKILITLRNWLGLNKAPILPFPLFLIKILAFFGNFSASSKINKDALKMLQQNNIATEQQARQFQKTIRFTPRNFVSGLFSYPSSKQDRIYAQLLCLKPLIRLSLAFMWLMSALVSAFIFPIDTSFQLLSKVGITPTWQPVILYSSCILNFLLAIGLLFNYRIKLLCLLQALVIICYSTIITIKLPYFWSDPFEPIIKNVPILVLIMMLYILTE